MANLPLAFGEILVGAIVLDAGIKGAGIADVVQGKATQAPLPGSGSTSASGSSGGGGSSKIPAGSYTNPFPGAKTGRIDQGVDYTITQALSPGKAKVLVADASNSGWGGGGYLALQLLDGPLAGQVMYIAEGFKPTVKVGQVVNAGAVLGHAIKNPYNGILGNIEAGWANPSNPGQPLAQTLGGYSGDQSEPGLTAGYSFSLFVKALGGIGGEFEGAGAALAHAVEQEFAGSAPAGVPYG